MIVRSYTGRTLPEALLKVKRELGEAALIIETRTVKTPGLLGTRCGYEVVAAKDDEPAPPARRPLEAALREPARPMPEPAPTPPASAQLERELAAIRAQLARLATGASAPRARLGAWADLLAASELPDDLLAELDEALARVDGRLDPALTRDFLAGWLRRALPVAPLDWERTRCLMLVGPTGVGKTTTIAKLAGELVHRRKRSVAIATIDTYRVGATDQLRAYADLLDVPLEVAQTPAQLATILQGFAAYDHVLIDTAGRSPADATRVHELRGFCRAVPATGPGRMAVMLAISAVCGRAEFAAVVERFSVLPLEHAVVTKLDECCAPGRLYGCLRRHHLAPAWFTTGQEVPADIAVATPELLVDRLFAAQGAAA